MAEMIHVEVVYALPERAEVVPVSLPEGATAGDAVQASGLLGKHPEIDLGTPEEVDDLIRRAHARKSEIYVELVDAGWNRLVSPTDVNLLVDVALKAVGTQGADITPYGDGKASERIVQALVQ